MKGKVKKNGIAYIYQNNSHDYFGDYNKNYDSKFPSKKVGNINYFGFISLKTIEKRSKTIKKLPSELVGKIRKEGKIELVINDEKNEIDLLSRGVFLFRKINW